VAQAARGVLQQLLSDADPLAAAVIGDADATSAPAWTLPAINGITATA
jgi:hypothetical protein